jgi:Zn-dependent oligopeptidase
LTTHCKENYDKKNDDFLAATAVVVCNFSKPTRQVPTLISQLEMKMIFHEFGHALHHTLTKAKYANNSGINVA